MKATDLKAGRELDQLVAEKVIGIILDEPCGGPPRSIDGNDGCAKCLLGGFWTKGHRPVPQKYSADILAAWEVVEKLGTWGVAGNGHEIALISRSGSWLCGEAQEIYDYRNEDNGVWASSAPLAICLYALKAAKVIE